jgi:hypothetical protein
MNIIRKITEGKKGAQLLFWLNFYTRNKNPELMEYFGSNFGISPSKLI